MKHYLCTLRFSWHVCTLKEESSILIHPLVEKVPAHFVELLRAAGARQHAEDLQKPRRALKDLPIKGFILACIDKA